MMRATERSIYRPGHIHMMVSAPGHVPLTTHIFVAGSPYIDEDAVFGKRDSLVVDFEHARAGQGGRRPRDEASRTTRRATTSASRRRRPERLVSTARTLMKIGKATVPRTAICTSDEHTIVVRGRDLSKELIGKVSFVDHFFLLLTGKMPTPGEAAVLNATLVAIAEHGLVPSVQAARMTFAAAPDAMQGAVAAGILGCGSVVLGSSETAGRMYSEIDAKVAGRHGARRGRARGDAGLARGRASRFPATATRCTRSATSASARCSTSRAAAGTDLRFVAIAEAVEALHARGAGQGR